mgnify:CR=1 FL=1
MRRGEKAVIEQGEIEKILKAGRVCQLAFAAEPAPYLVTLNYGYADGALYFHSAPEGRKLDLARENPIVGFTVALDLGLVRGEGTQACDWSTRYRSVVGYGRLVFLDRDVEKQHGLDMIMAQYASGSFSYSARALAATQVYRLEIIEQTAKQSRVD